MMDDIVAKILKFMPFDEQYETALEVLGNNKPQLAEFEARRDYSDPAISEVFDNWMFYKGTPVEGDFIYQLNVPVTSLSQPLPKQSLYKIPAWQELYNGGHVGDYMLLIQNIIKTPKEDAEISLTIANVKGSTTKFVATFDVMAYEGHRTIFGEVIASGTKVIEFSEACDMFLAEGEIVKQGNFGDDVSYVIYEDGTRVEYTDPPECEYADYKFGITKEVIESILF